MEFDDQRLGERLRQAREARGWSLSELAAGVGYPPEMVAEWESGQRSLKPRLLYRLAQVLGTPVARLFDEDENRFIPWNPNTGRLDICLHCGAREHAAEAAHCSECGYQLETSQCTGELEDAYLGMSRPCLNLIPPGQMHCQNCGTPSLWAELSDRLPRRGLHAVEGLVEAPARGELELALERLEELEQGLREVRLQLERLAGRPSKVERSSHPGTKR